MNLSQKGIEKELSRTNSPTKKLWNRVLVDVFKGLLVLVIFVGSMAFAAGYGMVNSLIDTAPEISAIDVSPMGFATTIYDAKGNLIDTLVTAGSNREAVSYSDIPQDMVNAFVAIEDSRFWTHQGTDNKGILRAIYIGLTSSFSEGASTITQQLIKNNVFNGGHEANFGERLQRKIQEQYLANSLEKMMSKEEILENYMNTINLGSNCLGVQAAAKRYFGKDVSELTLSECATIAGITQNPYLYNPITHPQDNADKRAIVLDYMEEQGYISAQQKQEALEDDVYTRIQANNAIVIEENNIYTYFEDELIDQVVEDLQTKAGYTRAQALNLLYSGGLVIESTQDPDIQKIVDEEISNPDNYTGVVNKFSFTYSLGVTHGDDTSEVYTENDIRSYLNRYQMDFDTEEEIHNVIQSFKDATLTASDTVLSEYLDITLQPQASMTVMDQKNGHVLAIAGGRGDKTTSLSLNRATQTTRQPGSTFKVLSAFAPAIDDCGATLGTVYYDEAFSVGEKSISNWWGNYYAGYSTIRQGIIYSMNVVAAKCLMETVTPEKGYEYCEDFGITTLVEETTASDGTVLSDKTASLALGGLTYGVTNEELTAAYAAIANGGVYTRPVYYTRILDNKGNVIIDNSESDTHRVIQESTAFLLTDAMRESIDGSSVPSMFSPSSTAARLDNMSAAGKSGTTTDNNDLWFVGFTPYYTCGIWTGFDDNAKLQTSDSNYHKRIWKKVMDRLSEGQEDIGFEVPENIIQTTICAKSGRLGIWGTCSGDPRGSYVYNEYFLKGTEPTSYCNHHFSEKVCVASDEEHPGEEIISMPGVWCPEECLHDRVFMRLEHYGYSQDSHYTLKRETCTIHKEPEPEPEPETEPETGPGSKKPAAPPKTGGTSAGPASQN